uniref:NADH-ubiquinone oxidoreductase chain 4 n=1 Tax=Haustorioides koreanus TaxID=2729224 RepID=A0A6M3RJ25_9CRUS|nr:NADH dehydrogenase subunit 4 [Haustorioides koreanus]
MLKYIFPLLLAPFFYSWSETLLVGGLVIFFFLLKSPISVESASFNLELDYLSWVLILLTLWIVVLSLLSSMKTMHQNKLSPLYLFTIMSLLLFLILTFTLSNFFMFYLMFESCLIPILLMILGWGYQPERTRAGVYMLFYTLFGSLPLLILILYINSDSGSTYMYTGAAQVSVTLPFICLISAFLIKFPMYLTHLWLLKAHVEAPVAGSMILAGVLLKLGGYGLIRFLSLVSVSQPLLMNLLISFSLWGAFTMSLICMRLTDMKLLIASSSVVHMGPCIAGLFLFSEWGVKGAVMLMVAHGLCSSGLFSLANMAYERSNSRSMLINKGLLNLSPSLTFWWFLLLAANMAAPPSINLSGEIFLLVGLICWNSSTIMALAPLSFFSAAYTLYLYSTTQHGSYNKMSSGFMNGSNLELLVLFLHWAPINLLILTLGFIL